MKETLSFIQADDKPSIIISKEQLKSVELGDWKFTQGPELTIPKERVLEVEDFLSGDFKDAYKPVYPYMFYEQTGFPSPIVRIEFSTKGKGNIKDMIYEVETRPAGLGLAVDFFDQGNNLRQYIGNLSRQLNMPIAAQLLPSIFGNGLNETDRTEDTRAFARAVGIPLFEPHERANIEALLWVRGGLDDITRNLMDEEDVKKLEQVALAPVRDHGNKNYLVELGLAENVTNIDQLDFTKAFALKPNPGSKTRGMTFYSPYAIEKGRYGFATQTKVTQLLQSGLDNGQGYLMQDYIPPQELEIDGIRNYAIARMFATLNLESGRYELLPGGNYTARPKNIKVHGASDSTIGKITF